MDWTLYPYISMDMVTQFNEFFNGLNGILLIVLFIMCFNDVVMIVTHLGLPCGKDGGLNI